MKNFAIEYFLMLLVFMKQSKEDRKKRKREKEGTKRKQNHLT